MANHPASRLWTQRLFPFPNLLVFDLVQTPLIDPVGGCSASSKTRPGLRCEGLLAVFSADAAPCSQATASRRLTCPWLTGLRLKWFSVQVVTFNSRSSHRHSALPCAIPRHRRRIPLRPELSAFSTLLPDWGLLAQLWLKLG